MRIGVVGLGGIAAAHLAAWRSLRAEFDLELHGFDAHPERAMVAGDHRHDSLESLLAAVDVVDICTPSFTHPAVIRAAADQRRPIICEKPLALSVDEAIATARYCRDRSVPFQVGQVVRYFAEYEAAHRAISSGAYGDPAVLRFRRASAQPRTNEWMHDQDRSGGIFVDLMIHDLDQAIWFAGPVAQVYGQSGLAKYGGAHTHSTATLTHASGAISQLTASWALAGGFETSFEIAATLGMLAYDSTDHGTFRADRPELVDQAGLLPVLSGLSPFEVELRELLQSVAFGAPARVGVADAIVALSVAVAARESARLGQPVIPQALPDDLEQTSTSWAERAGATW